jgi:hypothetical protein
MENIGGCLPADSSANASGKSLITFLIIALFAFLAIYRQQAPDALPEDAPLSNFSSARAMRHLRAVAKRPHPAGAPENAEVRNYILQVLASYGIETQVQTTTAINEDLAILVEFAATRH